MSAAALIGPVSFHPLAIDLENSNFDCNICIESRPRTEGFGHEGTTDALSHPLCRDCLHSYIHHFRPSREQQSLTCPTCRRVIDLTDQQRHLRSGPTYCRTTAKITICFGIGCGVGVMGAYWLAWSNGEAALISGLLTGTLAWIGFVQTEQED